MEFKYQGYNCKAEFFIYANGNKGIKLIDTDDCSPVTVATTNTDLILEEDCVAIKDYSENEGIVYPLMHYDVLSEFVGFIISEFVKIPVFRLSEKALGCYNN